MTLEEALNLPEDLEYTGEFGPELVLALPFFNWLSVNGRLSQHRIVTYKGMRCFYDDLGCREIVEKDKPRRYIHSFNRASWLPVKNEHTFDNYQRSPFHLWPDLRAKFRGMPMVPDLEQAGKPILVIHNKYCDEWGAGPVNFLPLPVLRSIFDVLSCRYTIVYIRHGMRKNRRDFVEDHNTSFDYGDDLLLKEYSQVRNFEDLYQEHLDLGGVQDVNTFKNVLYSRCYHFLSSQGGGAHQIALYSGSLFAVMHRRGSELKWAYGKGYYSFMAHIPPITLVCRNPEEMLLTLPAFIDAPVVRGRVLPRGDMNFISSNLGAGF